MGETNFDEDFSKADIEEGRLQAMLCYVPCCVNLVFIFAVFLNKNNDFHAFHARQGCGAALLQLATAIVLIVAGVIGGLAWGKLQHLMSILLYVVMIGFVGLNAYGMYLASKYEYEALPVVGPIFVKFLTFLHKAKG